MDLSRKWSVSGGYRAASLFPAALLCARSWIHCGCEPSVEKQGLYYYVIILSNDQAHLCIFVYTGYIANCSHL